MATVEIKAHKGVRNDVSSERFSREDLLIGTNIDIDETGKVSRRAGVTQLSAGATSSVWSNGKLAFFVRSSTLYQLHPDFSETPVTSGVGKNVSYDAIGDVVFWSDGVQSGRIEHGTNVQWGVPVPPSDFTLEATSGDLPAGTYGVTLVNLRGGMESGAPRPKYITVPANSGVRIDNLDATNKRIYMTRTNGEVFFTVGDLPPDEANATVVGLAGDSLNLRTLLKSPAPAGQIVKHYRGRMYVIDGNVIWYSDPYEYELFDKRKNYLQFETAVTIFAPLNDGVFVATEKETVFLSGDDPAKFQSNTVLAAGGVRGTLVYPRVDQLQKEGVQGAAAVWVSRAGVALGMAGGQLMILTGDRYVMPKASDGCGLFKIRSGTPQYVATLFN